jgi:hypothetical protein
MAEGWRKLGLAVEAPGGPLARSHAMLPTPLVLEDRVRVFFAACDEAMRGRIFFADIEAQPPHRLIGISPDPVLDVGRPGSFDCDGVNPSQVFVHEGALVLLYIGWRRGPASAPYTLFAGLARSHDGGLSFEKMAQPLLPPSAEERLFRTAPFVVPEAGGWRMLYIGGGAFIDDSAGKRVPIYSLREAWSASLEVWPAQGRERLAPDRSAGELGFGRPVVCHDVAGAPALMLSVRTEDGYTLAQAPLAALGSGRPAFEPIISPPFEPWEARMTCFGAPCRVGDRELLFYNGDGFGRTGFGMAWRPLT